MSGETGKTERSSPGEAAEQSVTLIRRAQAGDQKALDDLIRRYQARVLAIARLRLGPALRARLESRDIVQESFLRAVKGFGHFELREEGAFLHWMSTLVTNAIRDRSDYHSARKRRAEGSDEPLECDVPASDPTPSQAFARGADVGRLAAALDALPEESREVVIARDLEGLSFSEIGELLDRSPDAARMLYSRAKAKLSALLKGS